MILLIKLILPGLIAVITTGLITHVLFAKSSSAYKKKMLWAGDIILSESELAAKRDGVLTRYLIKLIPTVQRHINLESIILRDIRKMLFLMGEKKSAERFIADCAAYSLTASLPMLIVPVILDYPGYFAAFPLMFVFMFYYKINELNMKFKKWKTNVEKEIPDLIDKLRISFASGTDHILAFRQAYMTSGPNLKKPLERLLNDLQVTTPAKALDLFADSFKMPVVNKFTSAVKIAIEHGYEQAESYFTIIETDIIDLRQTAIEELTKSKPEKIYKLYVIMVSLSICAVVMKFWEIIQGINNI